MPSDKVYHFVAVNFNNSDETLIYIKSIISQDFKNWNIVIVDNNSTIIDLVRLEDFCLNVPNVSLIKNEKNIGYFPALNIGLNAIQRNESDYIIVGNNDLSFQKDFIEKLNTLVLDDDVLVIAPNIVKLDVIHQNPHIISDFNLIEKIYRRVYYSNYYLAITLQFFYSKLKLLKGGGNRKENYRIIPILMGYGACYILTPNFFKHYKYLDAPVFLMGEEGILASQVMRAGGITLYHPELVVNHLDHTSIGKIPNKTLFKYSQLSYKYFIKNCKNVR